MDTDIKRPDAGSLENLAVSLPPLKRLFSLEGLLQSLEGEDKLSPDSKKVDHLFTEGQYVRVMHCDRGDLIVGKKHRGKTLNVLLKGEMLVYTKDDVVPIHLTAGTMFESGEGVRKILIALQPSSFANIHVTQEKTVQGVEESMIFEENEKTMKEDITNIFEGGSPCLG